MGARKLIPWLVCVVLVMLVAILLLVLARNQRETVSMQTLANEIGDGQIVTIAIADNGLAMPSMS